MADLNAKYAFYLRKSRKDLDMEALGEGETLARHRHILDALAAKHDILQSQITVYQELVSGDSIQDRPEMQRLLADVYQRKYRGVFVVEIERLARGNTSDQGVVAEAFKMSNTIIYTPMKVYMPDDEFDEEYLEFGLFMSRREYKTIKRRMEAGRAESFKEGNYLPSHRPFGYEVKRLSKKDRILIPIPEEAQIVQMIYDWYTKENLSTWIIATKLTEMGVMSTFGNKEWNRGSIDHILSSHIYTGHIAGNKSSVKKIYDQRTGKMVKRKTRNPKEEWVIVKGKHEGIISQEQWDRAQELMKVKNPVKQEAKLRNPLAGLLKCKDCGRAINLQTYLDDRRIPRFYHLGGYHCMKKSAFRDEVYDAFIDGLKVIADDFERKMHNDGDQEELKRHQAAIETMEKELAKQERMKRRLFDSWEADDGTYTKEEFIERKQIYTAAIDQLNNKIKEAKQNAPEPVDYEEKVLALHHMIDVLKNPNLSVEAKNIVLHDHIERIDYDSQDRGFYKGSDVILDIYLK